MILRQPRKITLSPGAPKIVEFPGCVRKTLTHEWKGILVECTAVFGGAITVHLNVINTETRYNHRYWLSWIFDPTKPLLIACMLNPSTATQEVLDNTISGLMKRAMEWGYGGVVVVNVFAYRATKPTDMPRGIYLRQAIGKWNDAYIRQALLLAKKRGGTFICGWGSHKEANIRGKVIAVKAAALGVPLHALFVNESTNSPKHPLYIGHWEMPKPWSPV